MEGWSFFVVFLVCGQSGRDRVVAWGVLAWLVGWLVGKSREDEEATEEVRQEVEGGVLCGGEAWLTGLID